MDIPEEPPHILLRVWKYKASLEEDFEVIQRAEFELGGGKPDLRPSVYEIHPADVVRAVTEHFAGNGCDRVKPQEAGHLDVRPVHDGEILDTPSEGAEWFSFASNAHRELVLESFDDLMSLIARLHKCRRYPVGTAEVRAYLRGVANSAEWRNFLDHHEKGGKWVRFTK